MNIIFCPLTSRIIWLLRSMDSLKTCSLLQTCLCPTQEEMNWNDFNYHKKGPGFFLLYTSTPNRSTRRSSPCKVQGHRHLTATRNDCPRHWRALWTNKPLWKNALHWSHSVHSARNARTGEVVYVTQLSCSASAHRRREWESGCDHRYLVLCQVQC